MKRTLIAILLVIITGFTSCDYNARNFPGLEDYSKPSNVAQYQYEITTADISTIYGSLLANRNHSDSVMANALNRDKMFSDAAPASTLIPVILNSKYYAADKGSSANVTYQHKQEAAEVPGVTTRTEQFIFSSFDVSGWVFDPTLYVTMQKGKNPTDDYMMIVLYVKEKYSVATPSLINSYGDAEYYYGFNANYGNITLRESDRLRDPDYAALTTNVEKEAYLEQRTREGLSVYLSLKFPAATPQVAGIDVYCIVTTAIYDGPTTVPATYKYRCIEANPSKWEFD